MKVIRIMYGSLKNLRRWMRTSMFLLGLRISCKLKKVDLRLGKNIFVEENVKVCCSQGSKLTIGDNVKLSEFLRIFVFENAELVLLSRTGIHNYIHCTKKIRIGENVMMGGYLMIIDSNHKFDRKDKPIAKQGLDSKEVSIDDNVWLGIHTTILPGVNIKSGSIVGAGAVVTKSFSEDSIIGGVPAKLIKKR